MEIKQSNFIQIIDIIEQGEYINAVSEKIPLKDSIIGALNFKRRTFHFKGKRIEQINKK